MRSPAPPSDPAVELPAKHAPVATLTVCPECDLAQRVGELGTGHHARCVRCRAELRSARGQKLNVALAALLTLSILLTVLNGFPLVEMRVQGTVRATTLAGAAMELHHRGMTALALLVFVTTIVIPIVEVLLLAFILVPVKVRAAREWVSIAIGILQHVRPWSMIEVFMLGVLVSIVKLASLAEIIPGPALWACACVIVVMSFLRSILKPAELWDWVTESAR
jgi:paraquat-inducible protein A